MQVLAKPDDEVAKVWLEDCRHSFAQMIHDKLTRDAEEAKTKVSTAAQAHKITHQSKVLLVEVVCSPFDSLVFALL